MQLQSFPQETERNAVEIVNVVHDVKQLILFLEFPFLDLLFFKLSVSLVVNYSDIRNAVVSLPPTKFKQCSKHIYFM